MNGNMLNEVRATQLFNERAARALALGYLDEALDGAEERARQARRRKRRERVARALKALAARLAPPERTTELVRNRAPTSN